MAKEKNKDLEEGDATLCTVERISGTTVFVDIEKNGKGTIVTSEISPGRIRNLRDYVVPGKKIVCKVLNIDKQGNIHLSLRRTSEKEKKEVLEKYNKEKSAKKILESILENPEEIIKKIPGDIYSFLEKAKENPKRLEKLIGKENTKKVLNILEKRQKKQVEIKSYFKLTTQEENGINLIKKILSPFKEDIKYLSAEKFSLTIKDKDYKEANKKRDEVLKKIKNKAENKAEFEIIEK
jgi:translation initiation factor 2 alpha subunit (eIF-2alpha)